MTDKPTKPVEPGPRRTEAEQSQYAQDMAVWSAWIAEHPEDDTTEGETQDGGIHDPQAHVSGGE